MRTKLSLVLLLVGVMTGGAVDYYASPTGSSGNNGLTPGTACPLQHAFDTAGAGNRIIVLDGEYTPLGGNPFYVRNAGAVNLTVVAQNKWKAVLKNSASYGIQIYNCHHVTLDGLVISNSTVTGVKSMIPFLTVRNCKVTHNGNNVGQDADGIAANSGEYLGYKPETNVFEYNLIEYNGNFVGDEQGKRWGQAIYFSHRGHIVRNNIIRHGASFGIHLFNSSAGVQNDGNLIYGNLTYGHTNSQSGAVGCVIYGRGYDGGPALGLNHVFGNTILDGIEVDWGYVRITNNIIRSSATWGVPLKNNGSRLALEVYQDYNMSDTTISGVNFAGGLNNVITTYNSTWFNNAAQGRYWLGVNSPARVEALGNVYGPVDFFGNVQTLVVDIGFVQYASNLASDSRNLSVEGADFWGVPGGGGGGENPGSTNVFIYGTNVIFKTIRIGN